MTFKLKMFDLRFDFTVGSGTAADAKPVHARDAAAKPWIPAGEYLIPLRYIPGYLQVPTEVLGFIPGYL